MSTTDQQILDAAKAQLLATLTAGVEQFGERGEEARMIKVNELRATIDEYESKVARASGGSIFRPIVTGRGL